MSSYNLTKKADRERMRQERQGELDAIEGGTWPRDLNDSGRWNPPPWVEEKDWARRMCNFDIAYLAEVGAGKSTMSNVELDGPPSKKGSK